MRTEIMILWQSLSPRLLKAFLWISTLLSIMLWSMVEDMRRMGTTLLLVNKFQIHFTYSSIWPTRGRGGMTHIARFSCRAFLGIIFPNGKFSVVRYSLIYSRWNNVARRISEEADVLLLHKIWISLKGLVWFNEPIRNSIWHWLRLIFIARALT